MTKLFGVDIAKEIAKGMGSGLLPVQLIKILPGTRSTTEPTEGLHPSRKTYNCRGFIQDYKDSQFDGTTILRGDRQVLILGGTLPLNIVPQTGDEVKCEGKIFSIAGVPARDPAAATYICQARGA